VQEEKCRGAGRNFLVGNSETGQLGPFQLPNESSN